MADVNSSYNSSNSNAKQDGVVLVTGITGFLAGWIVKTLLTDGWKVRGTVRDAKQKNKYAHLVNDNLEVVEADLLQPDTWPAVVKGCSYVCHTASPFPIEVPKDEQVLIKPAVEGTLAVLKAAAAENSVKRVVLTSSVAAVRHGHENTDKNFNEDDWSIVEKCDPYQKSKTLAEKAAWDFMGGLKDSKLELAVINPSYIVGPLLSTVGGDGSRKMVERLMKNDLPAVPALWLDAVDVRDVATAHVTAITHAKAAGNRFVCSSGGCWMVDVANVLDTKFSPFGYKIPTFQAPKALLWVVSFWDKDAAAILGSVGVRYGLDNSKIQNSFGIKFRPVNESVIAMAESMIDLSIVPDLRRADNN